MSKHRYDDVMSRVIFFVERGRRPSRRERPHVFVEILRLLRSWDKVTKNMGELYRVSKNTVTNLYVIPVAMRDIVFMMKLATRDNRGRCT